MAFSYGRVVKIEYTDASGQPEALQNLQTSGATVASLIPAFALPILIRVVQIHLQELGSLEFC